MKWKIDHGNPNDVIRKQKEFNCDRKIVKRYVAFVDVFFLLYVFALACRPWWPRTGAAICWRCRWSPTNGDGPAASWTSRRWASRRGCPRRRRRKPPAADRRNAAGRRRTTATTDVRERQTTRGRPSRRVWLSSHLVGRSARTRTTLFRRLPFVAAFRFSKVSDCGPSKSVFFFF